MSHATMSVALANPKYARLPDTEVQYGLVGKVKEGSDVVVVMQLIGPPGVPGKASHWVA